MRAYKELGKRNCCRDKVECDRILALKKDRDKSSKRRRK